MKKLFLTYALLIGALHLCAQEAADSVHIAPVYTAGTWEDYVYTTSVTFLEHGDTTSNEAQETRFRLEVKRANSRGVLFCYTLQGNTPAPKQPAATMQEIVDSCIRATLTANPLLIRLDQRTGSVSLEDSTLLRHLLGLRLPAITDRVYAIYQKEVHEKNATAKDDNLVEEASHHDFKEMLYEIATKSDQQRLIQTVYGLEPLFDMIGSTLPYMDKTIDSEEDGLPVRTTILIKRTEEATDGFNGHYSSIGITSLRKLSTETADGSGRKSVIATAHKLQEYYFNSSFHTIRHEDFTSLRDEDDNAYAEFTTLALVSEGTSGQ
ncbi:MAG: hypothetical protein J6M53_04440 [Bacteroidaceae bacterium]|nr:hypothetical protein [Bacteroidaceae bacterium]